MRNTLVVIFLPRVRILPSRNLHYKISSDERKMLPAFSAQKKENMNFFGRIIYTTIFALTPIRRGTSVTGYETYPDRVSCDFFNTYCIRLYQLWGTSDSRGSRHHQRADGASPSAGSEYLHPAGRDEFRSIHL